MRFASRLSQTTPLCAGSWFAVGSLLGRPSAEPRGTLPRRLSGFEFTALARLSKIRSQGVRLRCCQGNRAVPAPAGRRYPNFCLLAWETSEVAIPDLPALETTAFAPGGAPASGGHGPDLRARAFSLPDAPGASGGRHHFILVPGKTDHHPPPACIPTSGWSQPNPASSPGPDSVGSSRPSFTLFSHCPALLSRTATSRPACLSRSPPRSMRSRTFSEHLGQGGQN